MKQKEHGRALLQESRQMERKEVQMPRYMELRGPQETRQMQEQEVQMPR